MEALEGVGFTHYRGMPYQTIIFSEQLSKLDMLKALSGVVDFTKYALSTIIY